MPRLRTSCCLLIVLLWATGCQSLLGIENTSARGDGDGGVEADASVSAFSVSIDDTTARINRSSARFVTINVVREAGFSETIELEFLDLPGEVTAPPVTVAGDATSAQIQVSAAAGAGLGPLAVRVQGTAGAVVRESPASLLIGDSPGTLDETFGVDGVVTVLVGADTSLKANAVAVRPDGKIVVGGDGWHLVQLLPDGTLDSSFGTAGDVTGPEGGDVSELELAPDGRVIAGGAVGADVVFRRYEIDGSEDATFGTTGRLLALAGGVLTATALDAQGNVLFVTSNMVATYKVERIASSGQLDGSLSFFPPFMSSINALATRDDLSFVGAGSFSGLLVTSTDSAGVPQTSFGGDGTATVDNGVNDSCSLGSAVLARPDGSVIVAGQCNSGGTNDASVASVLADGTTDTGFGFLDTGITGVNMGAGGSQVRDMALQPDGAFVMVGVGNLNGAAPMDKTVAHIERLFSTGADDSTFTLAFFGDRQAEDFRFEAVALQPDGRIVAVGHKEGAGYFVVRIWH